MQSGWTKEGPREDSWKDQLTPAENFNRVAAAGFKPLYLAASAVVLHEPRVPVWWLPMVAAGYLVCAVTQAQIRSRGERRFRDFAKGDSPPPASVMKNFVRYLKPF